MQNLKLLEENTGENCCDPRLGKGFQDWGVCLCVCLHVRAQSCLTLCNPMDYSLLSSSIQGISQARILE